MSELVDDAIFEYEFGYPTLSKLTEKEKIKMERKTEIHSNQFILIYVNKKTGEFLIPSKHLICTVPEIFKSYSDALHEAQRLAGRFTDRKYIVLAVAAVVETPVNPVTTTYHL